MNDSSYLLIDAGNSLCKFVVYNAVNDQKIFSVSSEYSQIEYFFKKQLNTYSINSVFICTVKNNQHIKLITEFSKYYWDCDIKIFNPNDHKYLPSKYNNFTLLGPDRWASILALKLQGINNYCIIDCGTAITVDYVIDSIHLGGLIGPGLNTLSSCLLEVTDKVKLNKNTTSSGSIDFNSKNTSECVLNASKIYFISFIEAILKENKKKYGSSFQTYITGGDNLSFPTKNNFNIVYSQNLVIEGLFYLKKELKKNENKKYEKLL